MKTICRVRILALASVLVLASGFSLAREILVSGSIQAAVNAARPGDKIRVPAGVYRECVSVTRDDITLAGSPLAILDGTGLPCDTGIHAAPSPGHVAILRFRIEGFHVRHYSQNGVLVEHGSDFRIASGRASFNGQYGIFALHSSGGLIEENRVSDSDDTGIYVGQSEDVVVRKNSVVDCTVGIEIENTVGVRVQGNRAFGNSTGILIVVLPGLETTRTDRVTVAENVLAENNRPNPVTDPADILSLLPAGVGLLNVGGDGVEVLANLAAGNDSAGIAVFQLPPDAASLDPRIDPFPDRNDIRDNVCLNNGRQVDPKFAPLPGGDLVWDTSGQGNCWSHNLAKITFPDPLPACR
jgi:parallel beta-helix repeat protein